MDVKQFNPTCSTNERLNDRITRVDRLTSTFRTRSNREPNFNGMSKSEIFDHSTGTVCVPESPGPEPRTVTAVTFRRGDYAVRRPDDVMIEHSMYISRSPRVQNVCTDREEYKSPRGFTWQTATGGKIHMS